MFDWDLFATPFLTGLLFAIMLPILGAYLRLRNEWLAALSFAHVAAAGALLGSLIGLPAVAGGMLFSAFAGAGQRLFAKRLSGEAAYALLLLLGWSVSVLVTANQPLAERLGHALFDGQLYFSSSVDLAWALAGVVLALLVLGILSRRLLLIRLYPDYFACRGGSGWPADLLFSVLTALALALATMSLGVMGCFALVFVPPWLAFRRAGNWRSGLRWAVALGVLSYLLAFTIALYLDQPFGAVLAAIAVILALLIA